MLASGQIGARKFTEGPITPTLVRFALPLLLINLLHSLSGTWGAIWAGRVLGPDALTAVVMAMVLVYMVMGAAMGIGTAAGVAIGQSLGAGDARAVKRVAGGAVVLVLGLALLLAVAGWVGAPHIVQAMGTPAAARDFAITHLRFTSLSMPSIFAYLVMVMMLRATGDARTPLYFTLLWIGLSVLLTPLLLAGVGGWSGLGIAGLGIAGGLASSVALGALVAYVYMGRSPIALRGDDLRHLRPEPVLMRLLLRRGLPQALESVLVQGSYFVLLSLVNAHGAVTAAAYAASAQLWAYVQLPSNALAAAMSAMAAMNIGANRWDRVRQIAWRGCGLSFGIAAMATALVYGLGEWPLRLFVPAGGPVLDKAWQINLIVLWGWTALAATMGLFAIMRANGAMLAPMLIFALTMWACRVPFAQLLEPWLGEAAIWWSFPFGTVCSALAALAWYRWGTWHRRGLMLAGVDTHADEAHSGA